MEAKIAFSLAILKIFASEGVNGRKAGGLALDSGVFPNRIIARHRTIGGLGNLRYGHECPVIT
jgi:hypothetical protein